MTNLFDSIRFYKHLHFEVFLRFRYLMPFLAVVAGAGAAVVVGNVTGGVVVVVGWVPSSLFLSYN